MQQVNHRQAEYWKSFHKCLTLSARLQSLIDNVPLDPLLKAVHGNSKSQLAGPVSSQAATPVSHPNRYSYPFQRFEASSPDQSISPKRPVHALRSTQSLEKVPPFFEYPVVSGSSNSVLSSQSTSSALLSERALPLNLGAQDPSIFPQRLLPSVELSENFNHKKTSDPSWWYGSGSSSRDINLVDTSSTSRSSLENCSLISPHRVAKRGNALTCEEYEDCSMSLNKIPSSSQTEYERLHNMMSTSESSRGGATENIFLHRATNSCVEQPKIRYSNSSHLVCQSTNPRRHELRIHTDTLPGKGSFEKAWTTTITSPTKPSLISIPRRETISSRKHPRTPPETEDQDGTPTAKLYSKRNILPVTPPSSSEAEICNVFTPSSSPLDVSYKSAWPSPTQSVLSYLEEIQKGSVFGTLDLNLSVIEILCRSDTDRPNLQRLLRKSRAIKSLFRVHNGRSTLSKQNPSSNQTSPSGTFTTHDALQSLQRIFPEAKFRLLEQLLAAYIAYDYVVRTKAVSNTPSNIPTQSSSEPNKVHELDPQQAHTSLHSIPPKARATLGLDTSGTRSPTWPVGAGQQPPDKRRAFNKSVTRLEALATGLRGIAIEKIREMIGVQRGGAEESLFRAVGEIFRLVE